MSKLQELIEKLEDKGYPVWYSHLMILPQWGVFSWFRSPDEDYNKIMEKIFNDGVTQGLIEVDFMIPNWK